MEDLKLLDLGTKTKEWRKNYFHDKFNDAIRLCTAVAIETSDYKRDPEMIKQIALNAGFIQAVPIQIKGVDFFVFILDID